MNVEIPDKLYFKIGEVAKLAGVPPHVLRYWESEFSAIHPKRANSKQRLYRRADVELILKLKELLHERRYTIAGARKYLADEAGGHDGGHEHHHHDHHDHHPALHHDNHHDQPHHEHPHEQDELMVTIGRIKSELQNLQKLLNGKRA
jgi:DNA-binding transcriptional MerR regulator